MASQVAHERGTTNTNVRGSSYSRRVRKWWLLTEFESDVFGPGWCHCYRCDALLCFDTITVDRIIPGCHGGTYVRGNIRPACGTCNSSTGAVLRAIVVPREERRMKMKIDEAVRLMDPPRYTRGQAAKIVGKHPDTLKLWKRSRVFLPSDRKPFGQLMVDLYTEDDITAMKTIAKTRTTGRKPKTA